ncbi:hypothetical protein DMB37_29710 [Nocardia sp. CS682]|nr:hypothetical protein DMB37_29710 [Nocardia sp. CS682]
MCAGWIGAPRGCGATSGHIGATDRKNLPTAESASAATILVGLSAPGTLQAVVVFVLFGPGRKCGDRLADTRFEYRPARAVDRRKRFRQPEVRLSETDQLPEFTR